MFLDKITAKAFGVRDRSDQLSVFLPENATTKTLAKKLVHSGGKV